MTDESLIDIVYNRIKSDIDKNVGGAVQIVDVVSFSLDDFWTHFGSAVLALSNEVTKIGFVCGKQPYPGADEMRGLLQDLLQSYTVMMNVYRVLPQDVGALTFKGVTASVTLIVNALLDFVRSLNNFTEKGAKERLTLTATFWDACNAIESLPRNNLNFVMRTVYAEIELAQDAYQELTTVCVQKSNKIETNVFSKTKFDLQSESVLKRGKHKNLNNLDLLKTDLGLRNISSAYFGSKMMTLSKILCKPSEMECKRAVGFKRKRYSEKSQITKVDYDSLKEWVCSKIRASEMCSSEGLRKEIHEAKKLYKRYKAVTNLGLTTAHRREQIKKLKTNIKDLSVVKKILDTEPPEKVFSIISQSFGENFTSQITNDSHYIRKSSPNSNITKKNNFYNNPFDENCNLIQKDSPDFDVHITKPVNNKSNSFIENGKQVNQHSIVLSETNYITLQNWVNTQTANNEQASLFNLQAELDKLNKTMQELNPVTKCTQIEILNKRIKDLSAIKYIFSADMPQFVYKY